MALVLFLCKATLQGKFNQHGSWEFFRHHKHIRNDLVRMKYAKDLYDLLVEEGTLDEMRLKARKSVARSTSRKLKMIWMGSRWLDKRKMFHLISIPQYIVEVL